METVLILQMLLNIDGTYNGPLLAFFFFFLGQMGLLTEDHDLDSQNKLITQTLDLSKISEVAKV
jgi:hypothetical protein